LPYTYWMMECRSAALDAATPPLSA
jgi:hypothetical protein